MIGQAIGGYTIARKLRDTAESELFLAEHRHIQRQAIVEVWRAELAVDQQVAARFLRTLHDLSALGHPGLVALYDADFERERIFAIREVLDGETLAAILGRVGNLASEALVAVALTRQIAGALAAAHGIGVFHGDLRTEDVVVVIDQTSQTPVVAKALSLGTAMLRQREGHDPPSAQSDCHAIGALLFELLTGKPPWPGCSPPSFQQPGISKQLDALVMELLSAPAGAAEGAVPRTMSWVRDRLDGVLGETRFPTSRKLVAAGSSIVVAPLAEDTALAGALADADASATLVDAPSPFSTWARSPETNGTPLPRGTSLGRTLLLTDEAGDGAILRAEPTSRTSPTSPISPISRSRGPRPPVQKRVPKDLPRGWRWMAGLATAIITLVAAAAVTSNNPARSQRVMRETRRRPAEVSQLAASPPGGEQPASSQPASSQLTSSQLAFVDLHISSNPPGAELILSDELTPRGVTPLVLRLPRGNKTLDLRLKAPGYLDKVLAADVSADHLVEVELTPEPAPEPEPTPTSTPTPAAAEGPHKRRSRARPLPKGHPAVAKPARLPSRAPAPAPFYPMGD